MAKEVVDVVGGGGREIKREYEKIRRGEESESGVEREEEEADVGCGDGVGEKSVASRSESGQGGVELLYGDSTGGSGGGCQEDGESEGEEEIRRH